MLLALKYYLDQAGIRFSDEEGQGLIEYVLIAALLSIVAIGAIVVVGDDVTAKFGEVSDGINTAPTTP